MRNGALRIHNPLPRDIVVVEVVIDLPPLVVFVRWVRVIASVGGEVFQADAYLAGSSGCFNQTEGMLVGCTR
jgi:hypothetical protein